MRISDLFEAEVVDVQGRSLGHVHDVRLVQDGPPIGPFGSALRVGWLICGAQGLGVRLGFARRDVRGPWPVRAALSALHGRLRLAPWDDVAAIEQGRVRLSVPDRALDDDLSPGGKTGRVVDAGLELLDRQIVDQPDGRMAGNVDDLELTFPAEGGAPIVTAILTGPGALARRIGGRLGHAIANVHERLRACDLEGPARVSFGVVASVQSEVTLTVSRQDLETYRFERWARDTIVSKIPGS